MMTNPPHLIHCIAHEHGMICRIRTIDWIGEPKVVPYQHAMTVTSVVKGIASHHTYPVTNHVQIHIPVHAYAQVIALFIADKHSVFHPPVAAANKYLEAVDKNLENAAFGPVVHFPNTEPNSLFVAGN